MSYSVEIQDRDWRCTVESDAPFSLIGEPSVERFLASLITLAETVKITKLEYERDAGSVDHYTLTLKDGAGRSWKQFLNLSGETPMIKFASDYWSPIELGLIQTIRNALMDLTIRHGMFHLKVLWP